MYKNIIIFIFLIHSQVAQTVPNDEVAPIQNNEPSNEVMWYASPLKLRSSIALIYDELSKRALYTKNADTVSPIASISKLMTAMVVLDAQLPMGEKIRISSQDMHTLKGTHSRMRPGMTLTRGDLVKLALMSSENLAAAALARTYPGGTVAAVAKMNAKALELGMLETRFLEPTGLNSGNVSTAQDLVKMVLAAQAYEPIHKATTSTFHHVKLSGYRPLLYVNSNPLVRDTSWDIGISKTGYISQAGRCLAMKASINKRPVVIVLLDSSGKNTRFNDANRIKNWIDETYTQNEMARLNVMDLETQWQTEELRERFKRLAEKSDGFVTTNRRKDGSPTDIGAGTSGMVIEEEPFFLFASSRDISEQKRAEKDIKLSESLYSQPFETAQNGILLF